VEEWGGPIVGSGAISAGADGLLCFSSRGKGGYARKGNIWDFENGINA
jgi:hypothetical protein